MIRRTWLRATPRPGWGVVRQRVFLRAGGRCECVLDGIFEDLPRCPRAARDVHHVVKRSQGGADSPEWNLIALCRDHHEMTDAPYYRGRLVVVPQGAGRYLCRVYTRPSKFALRAEALRSTDDDRSGDETARRESTA